MPARQGDRRLVLDQRHGLCARPCPRLRSLVASRRRGLGLFGCRPLFRPDGDLARRWPWRRWRLAGPLRPAPRHPGAAPQPARQGVCRGRTPGRVRAHRRLQRRAAGGLRSDGPDDLEGAALVGRQRLSAPGAEAPELRHAALLRPPGGDRGRPRCRGRDRARRPGRDRARPARGDRRRLVDQLAQAADAVGHRPGGASGGARHRGRRRPPRRRPESPGPSGALHPAGLHPADHALQTLQPDRQGADRGAMALVQDRAGRLEPVRERRLHPLQAGGRVSRHPVPLPAHGGALRRQGGGRGAWLPGPCRADALALARAGNAALGRPTREALDPVQLHEPRGGLGRFPPLHPGDPRDFRPARLRALPRQGNPARRGGAERRRTGRLHRGTRRERLSPQLQLPHGGGG